MSYAAVKVKLKFDRSRRHLTELRNDVMSYLARAPFSVHSEEDQATGDLVYRVQMKEPPPVDLGLPLGDAIHSARSALDYLAWQLVKAGGGAPSGSTAFPISETEKKFNDACPRCLRGASASAVAAVQALRPFQGGDDRFWLLHKLDIEDKHHLLIPVGASHRTVNVSFSFPDMNVDPVVLSLTPEECTYPLKDGTELFRVMQAVRENTEQGTGEANSFTFDVAFGEGVIVSGEPISPTLENLIGDVEGAVAPLFRFLN